MVEQQQPVVAHVAQRRHADREHREPVVEIGAEAAGLDFLAQVAVGGGDDARRLKRASAFRRPAGTRRSRGRAAAWAGGRAAVRRSRRGTACRRRHPRNSRTCRRLAPVKAPLHVAEERRFDQGGRDRRAVEREKRLVCARLEAGAARRRRCPCRCRIRPRSAPGRASRRTARSGGAASASAGCRRSGPPRRLAESSAAANCSAWRSRVSRWPGSHGLATNSTAPSVRAWRALRRRSGRRAR